MIKRIFTVAALLIMMSLAGCRSFSDIILGSAPIQTDPQTLSTPVADGPVAVTASGLPETAVKAWFEAAFSGDTESVIANTCAASAAMAETATSQFAAISASGSTVDISGFTYTKASESGDDATVTVGGTMSITVSGTTVDQPMDGSFPAIPLKREDGAWKVCGL